MADKRGARRAAEKAALAVLQKTMVSTAGDLAEADQRRAAADDELAGARLRAAEHVERAKQEAADMICSASTACGAAQGDYAAMYATATAAGWAPATLEEMGYEAPDGRRSRRGPRGRKAGANERDELSVVPVASPSRGSADDIDGPPPGSESTASVQSA